MKELANMPTSLSKRLKANLDRPTVRSSSFNSHLVITARAGTGKTTTLIEGLKESLGLETSITPSDQQRAIWEEMVRLAKGARSFCFCAFNSAIAGKLRSLVPPGCEAKTIHSLGNYAVKKAFNLTKEPSRYRVDEILVEILGKDLYQLRKENNPLITTTKKLVDLCKLNLVVPSKNQTLKESSWAYHIAQLIERYSIEIEDEEILDTLVDLVPRVLERCKNVLKDGYIDFSDMVWLPVVLNLPVWRNDLLLVDEAQDLNRCQQALIRKAGRHLILCGDPKQSIYAFAGADNTSMPRMEKELQEDGGCTSLPLTVTRRCGKAIVEAARCYVKDFTAHESNGEGRIETARYPIQPSRTSKTGTPIPIKDTYLPLVESGDMILCRVNAPLISQCLALIKLGKKAYIQGRDDVGASLISLVEKLDASTVPELLVALDEWELKEIGKEQAKRHPSETRIMGIEDRAECLRCFGEKENSVAGIIAAINRIFTEDEDLPGVQLSSIHRAKGLEANRVFFLEPRMIRYCTPKTDLEREQENNLRYVASTRAKDLLVYVS